MKIFFITLFFLSIHFFSNAQSMPLVLIETNDSAIADVPANDILLIKHKLTKSHEQFKIGTVFLVTAIGFGSVSAIFQTVDFDKFDKEPVVYGFLIGALISAITSQIIYIDSHKHLNFSNTKGDYSVFLYNKYVSEGNAFYQNNYMDRASSKYKKALKLNPSGISALNNVACVFANTFMYKKAISNLIMASCYDENNPIPYFNMGVIYFNTREAQKACDCWKKSSELGFVRGTELFLKHCQGSVE